jgi:hypothetical protein
MAKKKKNEAAGVCNLILPVGVAHLERIAQKLAKGESVTASDVNGGRMSVTQVERLWGIWNEEKGAFLPEASMNAAIARGESVKNIPSVPAQHQPVLIAAAKALGMNFAYAGQPARAKRQPSSWPSDLPSWKPGYTIGTAGGRSQALKDVRRNVVDPDTHLVQLGSFQYVIGDDKRSAVFSLHGSKGESTYAFNVYAVKSLAFRGREKDLANLVFQINNSVATVPTSGDGTSPGCQVVYLPNQVATAGYLMRDGKTMTYAQIAKAAEAGDAKGIRFKPLSDPIIGNGVTQRQLLAAVRKMMDAKATADADGKTAWARWLEAYMNDEEAALDAIWTNAQVQTRNNPMVLYCFGLRNSVTDMPLAIVFGDDRHDKRITCIVGQRCGDELTASSREALAIAVEEEIEEVKEESAPKAKSKAKSKSKPKSKPKPKSKRQSKPKAQPESQPETQTPADSAETVTESEQPQTPDIPVATESSDTADDIPPETTEAEETEQVATSD